MILLILVGIFQLVLGIAIGYALAVARTSRLLAAMSSQELQALGDRVVELRQSRRAS